MAEQTEEIDLSWEEVRRQTWNIAIFLSIAALITWAAWSILGWWALSVPGFIGISALIVHCSDEKPEDVIGSILASPFLLAGGLIMGIAWLLLFLLSLAAIFISFALPISCFSIFGVQFSVE